MRTLKTENGRRYTDRSVEDALLGVIFSVHGCPRAFFVLAASGNVKSNIDFLYDNLTSPFFLEAIWKSGKRFCKRSRGEPCHHVLFFHRASLRLIKVNSSLSFFLLGVASVVLTLIIAEIVERELKKKRR